MKRRIATIVLIVLLLAGVSLLMYPTVSNWINTKNQSRIISGYLQEVETLPADNYEELLNAAVSYNSALFQKRDRYEMNTEEQQEYQSLLNVGGDGVMGFIEIPKINVTIPIYHTTEDDILQFAAGHIPGTSLPVGGAGTHSAISGHRGLPSTRLFTDLNKLRFGDVFMIHVLNETLTYEIDQILIVEPENIEALALDPEKDYCTLVTCTPYAINTHRLLVRGHRIEGSDASFSSEAIPISPYAVLPFIAFPVLLAILIVVLIRKKK